MSMPRAVTLEEMSPPRGLIVGAAFVLPIALLVLVGFGLWRAIIAVRRPKSNAAQTSEPQTTETELSDD